ncbi:MAG TPA: T9SS type A sorting domain-containing protein, partial [Candidatus Kapabacteria bacterium]|nr:T9SS type A sorting domain-containing protein [Candidatus Kapabacteria bacterium]
DTVYLWSLHGNLYRSTDYGKDWEELFTLQDTATDWYFNIARARGVWIITGAEEHPTYPFYCKNARLAYSFDHGNHWVTMTIPVVDSDLGTGGIQIDGVDDAGRIYLYFGRDGEFRSDDWGSSWYKLSQRPWYVDPSGTIYAGTAGSLVRSTDFGATWQPISSQGIASLPFDMITFQQSAFVSTGRPSITNSNASGGGHIYRSRDDGQFWTDSTYDYYYYNATGVSAFLSVWERDTSEWLMVNTTNRLNQSGQSQSICGSSGEQPLSGIGAITSGIHVWIASGTKMSESLDTGCSYVSFSYDTISPTPILHVMEWAHDTILALSTSGIYRGYDVLFPFDTVTPEPGTQATPTGAMMKDSTGAIYAAMSDGKLFVTTDGANSWQSFASPTNASAPIISLTASPNGLLFAADSNLATGYTRTWRYDPTKQSWENVTSGLRRLGFSDTAEVTNIWYVNGYAYAGTWNMGLFRSLKPVGPVSSVASGEHYTPFRLFPNPASSFVTMTYPSFVKGTYRIVDIAGREMERGTIPPNSGKVTLDVHNLPNGLYEVTVGGGGLVPGKLVVNH